MSGQYLVFDIGCIECGEPSGVVGLFDTAGEAAIAAASASARHQADWHGQHYFDVFDLSDPASISQYATTTQKGTT